MQVLSLLALTQIFDFILTPPTYSQGSLALSQTWTLSVFIHSQRETYLKDRTFGMCKKKEDVINWNLNIQSKPHLKMTVFEDGVLERPLGRLRSEVDFLWWDQPPWGGARHHSAIWKHSKKDSMRQEGRSHHDPSSALEHLTSSRFLYEG